MCQSQTLFSFPRLPNNLIGRIRTIFNSTYAAYCANYRDKPIHTPPAINVMVTIKIREIWASWECVLNGLHYIRLCLVAGGREPKTGCLESVLSRHAREPGRCLVATSGRFALDGALPHRVMVWSSPAFNHGGDGPRLGYAGLAALPGFPPQFLLGSGQRLAAVFRPSHHPDARPPAVTPSRSARPFPGEGRR
jgi:hypothetical protein